MEIKSGLQMQTNIEKPYSTCTVHLLKTEGLMSRKYVGIIFAEIEQGYDAIEGKAKDSSHRQSQTCDRHQRSSGHLSTADDSFAAICKKNLTETGWGTQEHAARKVEQNL